MSQSKTRSLALGGSHAIVIGGSVAGMLAACVLTNHFDRVTIIERDTYPETVAPRKGVPQSRHLHGLLARGLEILEDLFPGFRAEMIQHGALPLCATQDIAWYTPAGWGVRFDSELEMLTFSRDLLDWVVRQRLLATPQVRFLEQREVVRLLTTASRKEVDGIVVRRRSESGANHNLEEMLYADLVADCSGRRSHAPDWLQQMGYEAPPETIVDSHLGYASRLYRRTPGDATDWKALYYQAAPPKQKRGGILFPIEGDRWIVTLAGGDRDYPPLEEEGFLAFARSLPGSALYDLLKKAEPLTPIVGHRGTENRLRHFERLERFPERFLVMGDAACAFNPVYGQGMTTAAMGAMTLDACLRERPNEWSGLSKRFQSRLAKVNETPWMFATGEDYRYPSIEGAPPGRLTRWMHGYVDQVVRLATQYPSVRKALLETFSMRKPPQTLFRPDILARALVRSVRAPKPKPVAHCLDAKRQAASEAISAPS